MNLLKKYTDPVIVKEATMMHVQAFAAGYQPSDIRSLAINILNRKNGLLKKTYKGQWNSCDEMLEEKPINN